MVYMVSTKPLKRLKIYYFSWLMSLTISHWQISNYFAINNVQMYTVHCTQIPYTIATKIKEIFCFQLKFIHIYENVIGCLKGISWLEPLLNVYYVHIVYQPQRYPIVSSMFHAPCSMLNSLLFIEQLIWIFNWIFFCFYFHFIFPIEWNRHEPSAAQRSKTKLK